LGIAGYLYYEMGAMISSIQDTVLLGVLLAGLYLAYRAALPKPLGGIPYNRDAARKLFGDVPEMMAYVMRTKRVFVSAIELLPSCLQLVHHG